MWCFLHKRGGGGSANPFINALPACIEINIEKDYELQSPSTLLAFEGQSQRCGSGSVINRLGEVLLVCLLRAQLSEATADVRLLGALADPQLGQSIVATHESPERRYGLIPIKMRPSISVS